MLFLVSHNSDVDKIQGVRFKFNTDIYRYHDITHLLDKNLKTVYR